MYVLTTQIYYKKQIPKVPYYPEQNILPSCPSPKFMDSHAMVKFHINSQLQYRYWMPEGRAAIKGILRGLKGIRYQVGP